MVIIIDGPEKAGKSTLAKVLGEVTHFDKPRNRIAGWCQNSYAKYMLDAAYNPVAVWDRSWASDWVYGILQQEWTPFTRHPWLGEWLFGRAFVSRGLRVMLLGPGGPEQFSKRTPDDPAVDPHTERELFRIYGERFGWEVLTSGYGHDEVDRLATHIHNILVAQQIPPMTLTQLAGPWPPRVLVVGHRTSNLVFALHSMPFSSREWTIFGTTLGDSALQVSWLDIDDGWGMVGATPEVPKLVVLVGQQAIDSIPLRLSGAEGTTVFALPSPREALGLAESKLHKLLQEYKNTVLTALKE